MGRWTLALVGLIRPLIGLLGVAVSVVCRRLAAQACQEGFGLRTDLVGIGQIR